MFEILTLLSAFATGYAIVEVVRRQQEKRALRKKFGADYDAYLRLRKRR